MKKVFGINPNLEETISFKTKLKNDSFLSRNENRLEYFKKSFANRSLDFEKESKTIAPECLIIVQH